MPEDERGAPGGGPTGPGAPGGGASGARDGGPSTPSVRGARPSGPEAQTGTAVVGRKRGGAQRLRTTLDLIRSNPTGRIALKIFVAITGAMVVAIGIVLIPLPGPGWLIVIGGLAIWAVEFHWARRLLTFTRRNLQAWTRWVTRQSLPVRILIAGIGLVFICAVVWLSLKFSLGIDLVANLMRYLATH